MQKDRQLTEIDQQVLLKLFHFSIHRYSEVNERFLSSSLMIFSSQVRRRAQQLLLFMLAYQPFTFEILVDPIAQVLNKPDDEHHDQLKVQSFFFFDQTEREILLGLSLCSSR